MNGLTKATGYAPRRCLQQVASSVGVILDPGASTADVSLQRGDFVGLVEVTDTQCKVLPLMGGEATCRREHLAIISE
jgi:hypothetical protein